MEDGEIDATQQQRQSRRCNSDDGCTRRRPPTPASSWLAGRSRDSVLVSDDGGDVGEQSDEAGVDGEGSGGACAEAEATSKSSLQRLRAEVGRFTVVLSWCRAGAELVPRPDAELVASTELVPSSEVGRRAGAGAECRARAEAQQGRARRVNAAQLGKEVLLPG